MTKKYKYPCVQISYDQEADSLYLTLKQDKIAYTKKVYPNILFDFNKQDEILGIEIIYPPFSLNKLRIIHNETD